MNTDLGSFIDKNIRIQVRLWSCNIETWALIPDDTIHIDIPDIIPLSVELIGQIIKDERSVFAYNSLTITVVEPWPLPW